MIDTLVRLLAQAFIPEEARGLNRYALVTLHRPSNVDETKMLTRVLKILGRVSRELPVLFPVHPRTRRRIEDFGLCKTDEDGVRFMSPLPYVQFLGLQRHATVVITDSGGIQEETTFLGVPCLTLRENTERPITVAEGTNILIGSDPERLFPEVMEILSGRIKQGRIPVLWDGRAGERIAKALAP
jgi:UDP-N-acetylglucosamine 2-epimerase (non-hydrolysing)